MATPDGVGFLVVVDGVLILVDGLLIVNCQPLTVLVFINMLQIAIRELKIRTLILLFLKNWSKTVEFY